MAKKASTRRYPGLKPFDRSQSALFRGRQDDVLRLSNLILRGRLTVLFAKSGIGKTSILQAGVAPELEDQGFLPILIRAENTSRPLVESVRTAISLNAVPNHRDATAQLEGMPESIWELMKRLRFEVGGLPATPVLVFDQFEEVFTLDHQQQSRNVFLSQLADLCNESTPEDIHGVLIQNARGTGSVMMSPEAMQWWDRQPEVRIVISMRSDFLHKLDEISTLVPGILRNRFQLQPLNRDQAREAILTPAAAFGSFASPVFCYSENAITTILDFLSGRTTSVEVKAADGEAWLKKQDEIEAFNLQIICQNIEETIIREDLPENYEVTSGLFGDKAGLESQIRDFYIRQIENLPNFYSRRTGVEVDDLNLFKITARKMIEEDLITSSGRRNSVVQETLIERWQVSQAFLDTLVESRLLRKELRLDSYYFEISHDTLLPAAIASRNTRRTAEKEAVEKARLSEELRAEALKRQEIENQLREAKRQRRMARMVSILSISSLVLCMGMGILFFNIWAESVETEFLAAEENCRKEQFDAATEGYRILSENRTKNWLLGGKIAEKGEDAQRFKNLFDAFSHQLAKGDSLFFLEHNPDFAGALTAYRAASDALHQYERINYQWVKGNNSYWRVEPERIEDRKNDLILRINSTRKTLISQFIVSQREAEAFKEAGIWGQQRRNLRTMQGLLPIHPEDQQYLNEALNMRLQTAQHYVDHELDNCNRKLGKN